MHLGLLLRPPVSRQLRARPVWSQRKKKVCMVEGGRALAEERKWCQQRVSPRKATAWSSGNGKGGDGLLMGWRNEACLLQAWATPMPSHPLPANNLRLEGTGTVSKVACLWNWAEEAQKQSLSIGMKNVFFAERAVNLYTWIIVWSLGLLSEREDYLYRLINFRLFFSL